MAMINRSVALIAGVPLGLQDPSSGGSSDFLVPRHISLPPLSPIMIELNPSEERLPINVEQQERHRQEEEEEGNPFPCGSREEEEHVVGLGCDEPAGEMVSQPTT